MLLKMKFLFVSFLIMASAILINLDYVSAESLNKELSFSEDSLNDLGLNIENNKDSLEGTKIDNEIFGDEQTFPFVAGLGKNAAH